VGEGKTAVREHQHLFRSTTTITHRVSEASKKRSLGAPPPPPIENPGYTPMALCLGRQYSLLTYMAGSITTLTRPGAGKNVPGKNVQRKKRPRKIRPRPPEKRPCMEEGVGKNVLNKIRRKKRPRKKRPAIRWRLMTPQ
jgi:hypothetical protein